MIPRGFIAAIANNLPETLEQQVGKLHYCECSGELSVRVWPDRAEGARMEIVSVPWVTSRDELTTVFGRLLKAARRSRDELAKAMHEMLRQHAG